MNSKGKNATQTVAQRFAPAVRGEKAFSLGTVLNCDRFLTDYGWEFNAPSDGQSTKKNVILEEFSQLLNNDKSGAFNTKPEFFRDIYVVVKRNEEKEIIAGAAFHITHIDTVRVCYIESIVVREGYRHLGVGSQLISLLKECLRSFRGQGKDEIQYLYLFAQVSRVAKPHKFFEMHGAKAGFPTDFASWKDQELDQMYIPVQPYCAKDTQNIVRDPLLVHVDERKSATPVNSFGALATAKGSKGKSKAADKARSAINLETKAPLTPTKAARSVNQKSAQQIKKGNPNTSETESTFSKMTSKSKSGAINKHCIHEKCQGKWVSGAHWSRHLTNVHEGAAFKLNKEFYFCDGEECDLCQEYKGYQGKQPSYKCNQCSKTKRHDHFPKENKEVCNVCVKGSSSESKGFNSSAEKTQPQLTQENLQTLEDQLMDEDYASIDNDATAQEAQQIIQQQQELSIHQEKEHFSVKPSDSLSQVGKKRLHSLIEDHCDNSVAETQKRSNVCAESLFLQSSVSQTIVVGHTDLSVIDQLRQLETSSENSFVGAQTIQDLCNIFSQDVVVQHFMKHQSQFVADCIISSMKRCDDLNGMQVSGLVVAAFFIKGKCWEQAIKLINQSSSDRRAIVLDNLSMVLAKHFNEDVGSWVNQFYRYIGQQQLDIISFFKETKVSSFTDSILMLSLTVDTQNIPLFVKTTGLFVKTAPIAELLLDTITERPVQTKMSYEAFTELAVILQEKDYRASINTLDQQLRESNIIEWADMIKHQQQCAHILDENSVQEFLDQLILTYKDTKLDKDLSPSDERFQLIMAGLFERAPNKKQFAVAQYCIGKLYTSPRQLWIVPSGQGKSRIIATAAIIAVQCGAFSKVHLVFENEYLLNRDKADFEGLWMMCQAEEQIEYHLGCDFVPQEGELVIIDEADALIYKDPLKFKEFVSKNACVCFTATSDSKENKIIEERVVSNMQLAKFYYVLNDRQAQQPQKLDFDFVASATVDKTAYIAELAANGPVIFYGTVEQADALEIAGLNILRLTKETDTEILRHLDEKQDNEYLVVVATDCAWMRGTDFRSQSVKMTLVIAQSFENYREAIQGFNRVGRFGDSCQRVTFADIKLVDKVKEDRYKANLFKFVVEMQKKPVILKPVTVKEYQQAKPKVPAAKKEEKKMPTADEGKRTPGFGQKRTNQLLAATTGGQQSQINFKKAEQPIINNNIMEQKQ